MIIENNSNRSLRSWLVAMTIVAMTLALFHAPASFGQGAVGSIVGTVKDSSGAVVPGAHVTVTDIATNVSQKTQTNSDGNFAVRFLKPANYRVTVESQGFSTTEATYTLQVDQIVRADATLTAGHVNTTVVVKASGVALDTDSATVGQVITERQVQNLPMDNRDFTNLLLLSPGAITTSVNELLGSYGGVVDVSGARATSNGFLIDGLVNTEAEYDLRAVPLSLDAIEEFKQQATSYTAEYGGSATQFNLSTKSGSNSPHGTVFEFNRNNAYDGRAFFDPPKLPPLRQNNYGYSFGGPVYIPKIYNGKNRSFFFANFERLIATTSATAYPLGPDANALQGILASAVPVLDPSTGEPFSQDENGNYLIPTNRWSRLATVSTAVPGRYFPVPGPMQNGGNSVVTISSPTDQRQQTYRFDQTISSKDQMFARFTLTNFANTSDGNVALQNTVAAVQTHSWVVNETHTFNSNLVNQAKFGRLVWADLDTGTPAPSADLTGLGLQNIFSTAGASFPALQFSLLSQFGGADNVPGITNEGIWDFSDTLSWLHGRHNITTGFSGYLNLNSLTVGGNPIGVYDFDGTTTAPSGTTPTVGNVFADFLLGDIVSGNATVPTPYSPDHPFEEYPEHHKFAIFVNDNWKVSDRLNVNIGLRYDYQGIPREKNNHWFWRDLTAPGGALCVADKSLITSGVGGTIYKWCGRTDAVDSLKKPFAPRVGLVFRPFSSDNTMVRAGYGIFFDQYDMNDFSSGGFYPYAEEYNLSHQSFDSLFPTIPPAAPVTGADLGFLAVLGAPVPRDPYLQTWSLSVQQALFSSTKLDIAYVGSRGSHLGTRVTASQPTSYDPSDPGAGYPLYNFGTFGQDGTPYSPGRVIEGNFEAKSNYNSLQVSVDHRSKDAAILVSYTWSSSMDTASSVEGGGLDYDWAGPMDTYDIDRDYSKSAFDVPQRLVASFVYLLPFGRGEHFASTVNRAADALIGGWQVNGIYEAQNGTPEVVYAADLDTALQAVTQRSNQIASPYPSGFHKSYKEWFDVDSFTQPAVGVFGTTHRNSIRAPGLDNFDTSVVKNFPIFERMSFQLRLEAFNALNHAQFGAPGYAVPGSPSLATINTTIVPGRIVQLGGKIIF